MRAKTAIIVLPEARPLMLSIKFNAFIKVKTQKIIERPLVGYGANYEPKLLNESGSYFTQVHKIYLSWMLWGA